MTRILIADEFAIVRRGLRSILEGEQDLQVVGEASSLQEALSISKKQEYDVLIIDISSAGFRNLDSIRPLKETRKKIQILVLSTHPEDQYAIRALKAGASGYITKASDARELVQATRKVARGGKYISPEVAEQILMEVTGNSSRPSHENLSDREFTVMKMLASGKRVSEIATELMLSVKTISTYRRRILDKTKLDSNAALTRYALEHQLLD